MDEDDPETRIAELERRLTEDRGALGPRANQAIDASGGWLTPEQVRDVAFSKPPVGRRGYNEDDVDAFLELVEATLRGQAGGDLTAEDVHEFAFSKPPAGKRGYNIDQVDALLELIEGNLRARRDGLPPPPQTGFAARPASRPPPRADGWFRRLLGG
jgi:DivIVA domain-containing protein